MISANRTFYNPQIEYDFEKNFGHILKDKANLIVAWNTFFVKSKEIFGQLKNAACREILREIKEFHTDEAENEKNVTLLLALHGLFIPTLMSGGGGKTFKPSIVDSQDSLLQLTTEAAFDNAMEVRRATRQARNLREHPIIVAISVIKEGVTSTTKKKKYNKFIYDIRDVQKIETFRVVFGPVQFQNDNMLNALDFCFKIYKSFKIEYPECAKTLRFLNTAFYGIANESTSKIAQLLNTI